ncbi:unnamed protein product, partial [Effrenium voratum]
ECLPRVRAGSIRRALGAVAAGPGAPERFGAGERGAERGTSARFGAALREFRGVPS